MNAIPDYQNYILHFSWWEVVVPILGLLLMHLSAAPHIILQRSQHKRQSSVITLKAFHSHNPTPDSGH